MPVKKEGGGASRDFKAKVKKRHKTNLGRGKKGGNLVDASRVKQKPEEPARD